MTTTIERARSAHPVSWLTLVGLLLLPAVIGGVLVAALFNPTERLDAMQMAVVNDDEPVTIDEQTVPLGRQLTAGLVEGSDELDSNLTWVISNEDDAAAGLVDGTYDAVVTIPSNFSAAATSTAPGGIPEQATIEVTTAPDALIVDDAITAQVTSTAASVMGEELSSVYLENVFLGFTTLGDELGTAADGADELADGAAAAADGAQQLADGAAAAADGGVALADGSRQLASGADSLAAGAAELATGADEIAAGQQGIADGAAGLATGTRATADGLDEWAAGADELAGGASQLAGGLQQLTDEVSQIPTVPGDVLDDIDAVAADSDAISATITDAAGQLADLAAGCVAAGGSEQLCASLGELSTQTEAALPQLTGVVDRSDEIAAQVRQLAALGPQLTDALQQSTDAANQLAGGMSALGDGATEAADGSRRLADGADELSAGAAQLADGTSQLADGASQLSDGAGALADGAGQGADGAAQLADGVSALGDGAAELADGNAQLSDGTATLADGLHQAAASLPSYTDEEATDLASVVTDPVAADGLSSDLFGASAVPLLTAVALWFGALAGFVVLQAVPRGALTSRRSSIVLALHAFWPAAVLGVLQGVLVASVVQLAADYDWATWTAFAGLASGIAVVFAAVNQALVALLGGAGRWVSAVVGVLAVATGIVSTVPGALAAVAGLMPTSAAYQALLAALTGVGGLGAAMFGLVVWSLVALLVTVLVVARRRSTTASAVLAARPA